MLTTKPATRNKATRSCTSRSTIMLSASDDVQNNLLACAYLAQCTDVKHHVAVTIAAAIADRQTCIPAGALPSQGDGRYIIE